MVLQMHNFLMTQLRFPSHLVWEIKTDQLMIVVILTDKSQAWAPTAAWVQELLSQT